MRIEVPVPQSAIAGPDGRVAKEWRAFFISLANALRNDTGTIDGSDILASTPTPESAISDLKQRVSQLEEMAFTPQSFQKAIADLQAMMPAPTVLRGNVAGPLTSTDNAVARFDGTTGKKLQNSVVIIDDAGNIVGVIALTATGLVTAAGFDASGATTYKQNNVQVVGARGAAVADAAGGATIDAEARTAINTWLARARVHGLIA